MQTEEHQRHHTHHLRHHENNGNAQQPHTHHHIREHHHHDFEDEDTPKTSRFQELNFHTPQNARMRSSDTALRPSLWKGSKKEQEPAINQKTQDRKLSNPEELKRSQSSNVDLGKTNDPSYLEGLFMKNLDASKTNVHLDAKKGKAESSMEEPVNPSNPLNVLEAAVTRQHVDRVSYTSQFEKILNFRDLCEGDPHRVKKGMLFRSGLIHLATEKDFQMLQKVYGIKTTIDLRSSDEIRQSPSPVYEQYFPSNRAFLGRRPCRVHVPLWKVTMNFKILLEAKKYRTLGQIAMSFAKADKQNGIKLLLGEMNEIKLPGMYKCFIKYVQPQIREAMEIISNPENYPIMIHCSLGKDRTGVMSALVSELVGMNRNVIFEEYSESEKNLFPVKQDVLNNLHQYYLEDWLADSPVEVMSGLFNWMEETYGSIPQFLELIGFDRRKQKQVYTNLAKSS